jgi:hypothetical protein
VQIVLLALSLGLGQWLEKKHIDWMSEAGVALLLGVLMGVLSRIFTFSKTYVDWMSFSVSPLLLASPKFFREPRHSSCVIPSIMSPSCHLAGFLIESNSSSFPLRRHTFCLCGAMQTKFFFIALLPPIMFEAGFSLQVKP